MKERTIRGVVSYISREVPEYEGMESVLMIVKHNGPYARHIALPGGKVEPDETDIDALRRELLEETNLELNNFRYSGRIIFPDNRPKFKHLSYDVNMFDCNVTDFSNMKAGSDAKEIFWLGGNYIIQERVALPVRKIYIEKLRNHNRGTPNDFIELDLTW